MAVLWGMPTMQYSARSARLPQRLSNCRIMFLKLNDLLMSTCVLHHEKGAGTPYRYAVLARTVRNQEISSSWDRRPFGHNRHGPKIGGGCAPDHAELLGPGVLRYWKMRFLAFFRKTTPYGKVFKILFHCLTDRRVVFKFSKIWPTAIRQMSWNLNTRRR